MTTALYQLFAAIRVMATYQPTAIQVMATYQPTAIQVMATYPLNSMIKITNCLRRYVCIRSKTDTFHEPITYEPQI